MVIAELQLCTYFLFSNILTTLEHTGGFFKEAQVAWFMMMMN